MSSEANKITLRDVSLHQLTLLYRHFSTRHEFYAATQIQTIIKTENARFSPTNAAWTYAVIFFEFG